jgi:hypothetical protein
MSSLNHMPPLAGLVPYHISRAINIQPLRGYEWTPIFGMPSHTHTTFVAAGAPFA